MKIIFLIAVLLDGTPIVERQNSLEACVERVAQLKVTYTFKHIACRTLRR